MPDAAALLLIVLDARYTLVYRQLAAHSRGSAVSGAGGAPAQPRGASDGSVDLHATTPGDLPSGGLELVLVEGKRALSGDGAKWLLERAKAFLVDGCRDAAPEEEPRHRGSSPQNRPGDPKA